MIAAAVTMRGARRVLAIVLVPLVLLSTALGVDSIYGEYQTIGTLVATRRTPRSAQSRYTSRDERQRLA